MINVSAQAATVIESTSRNFKSRFLLDGAEVSGNIQTAKVHKGSTGESKFVPGSIYSSSLDVVLSNVAEKLEGKELEYQIGTVLADGSVEWTTIGFFTVHKPSTDVYKTTFTGLGRLSAKMGGLYTSKLVFPATIQSVLDEISESTGIPIVVRDGLNTDGLIETKPTGYMYREVLAFIAGIFFGYATEDSAGQIVISKFSTTDKVTTHGDRTVSLPTFADLNTVITGVKVIVSEGDSESEDVEEVSFTSGIVSVTVANPFMTQALFDENVGNVVGLTYSSGTVPISTGDFRLEPFDSMEVTDIKGIVRTIPCMYVAHTFDGGIQTEVIAPGLDNEDGGTAYRGVLGRDVQRMKTQLLYAEQIIAKKLSADEADLKYAKIDFANIGQAAMEYFYSKSGLIENVVIKDGVITGEIVGVTIKGDLIEGGTVKADKLVILGSDGLYYKLNTNGETVESEQTEYNSLDGKHILAKSITATKINVSDLVAFGATIGGFNIKKSSIYSGAKESVDNTTRGIYMDAEGQWVVGDLRNFIKYYKDENGEYKLDISAKSVSIRSPSDSDEEEVEVPLEDAINDLKSDIDNLRDEITTLLRIESSRGTVFKNDTVATVLSVVIYHGTQRITDSATMKTVFGNGAYLQWKWQRLDDNSFGIISSSDSRFGDNGFTFTLSPNDVDTKVTFMCELIT